MSALLDLAARVEAATGADRALNREVALACGWHRYSPSEIRRSNPGWIAPEDFIGETVGKDGRKSPILDSLHGTTVWREPRDYLVSLDAALTLVPEAQRPRWSVGIVGDDGAYTSHIWQMGGYGAEGLSWAVNSVAATPALALCAAALRARAAMGPVS